MKMLDAASLGVALLAAACGGAERHDWQNTYDGKGEDAFLVDDDFTCMAGPEWQPLAGHFFMNTNGHLAEALAVARSKQGGLDYPVGTVIQSVLGEAMVKRGKGFDDATHDWEYVQMDVSSGKTVLTARGTEEVWNAAGTCNGCHAHAKSFDQVCFTSGQCPGVVVSEQRIEPARDDPRCR